MPPGTRRSRFGRTSGTRANTRRYRVRFLVAVSHIRVYILRCEGLAAQGTEISLDGPKDLSRTLCEIPTSNLNLNSGEKTPSFSSSLLDAIYRSIDETKCEEADDSVLYRESTTARTKKQRNLNEETLRQAIMIEKLRNNETISSRPYNSNSSSSDSSCGGVFSSSETESGSKSNSFEVKAQSESGQTQKREGRLTRTKSKALKIYGDLKRRSSRSRRAVGSRTSSTRSSTRKMPSLENITAIGAGAYGEELPVYGTTSLKTHHAIHAISNGLIL
ncbi:hypothetical protein Acr_12g0010360 [Actinidia rufa]|uniref:Uncharacterized protein n=1 Tax=Actinidia rufa TaxID=165716 RepID=A0A7J0FIH4_9ERIC|nr:hypothetical protein Acr_12g0010360 [Actinidia rufa]